MLYSSGGFNSVQPWLIPNLEIELGQLSDKQTEFVTIVESMNLEKYVYYFNSNGKGRPAGSRLNLFKAFIAKAIYNFPTTKLLQEYILSSPTLRRLCGWEYKNAVPSESTFSRAFQEFTDLNIATNIHADMTSTVLNSELLHHASIDGTSIQGREKTSRKKQSKKNKGNKTQKKRGRPKKGESVVKEEKRVDLQGKRSLEDNLNDLPQGADWGAKKDSKGSQLQKYFE
jgi:transposase